MTAPTIFYAIHYTTGNVEIVEEDRALAAATRWRRQNHPAFRGTRVIKEIVPIEDDDTDSAEVGAVIEPVWTVLCCEVVFGLAIPHHWFQQRCKRCGKSFVQWLFEDLATCVERIHAEVAEQLQSEPRSSTIGGHEAF